MTAFGGLGLKHSLLEISVLEMALIELLTFLNYPQFNHLYSLLIFYFEDFYL